MAEESRQQTQNNHLREDIEQLSATLSHDLCDPLRMAVSYCRTLRDMVPEEALHLVNSIEYCITDTLTHVRDVRKYACLSGSADAVSPVDVAMAVREAEQQVRGYFPQIPWRLTATDGPFSMQGNHSQLVQMFAELFTNALKFSHRMEPSIRVDIHTSPHHHLCHVTDDGVGMEPEYCTYVFGLFKKIHPDAGGSGTGAGLAMCRRIARNHGGDIALASEPGYGCRFTITLPRDGG